MFVEFCVFYTMNFVTRIAKVEFGPDPVCVCVFVCHMDMGEIN